MNSRLIFLLFSFLNMSVHSAIHVIGDSHSRSYQARSGCYPSLGGIQIHWIGPITMHRVGRDGIGFLNLRNYGVKEGDTAVFVFGEIDVRCHIGRIRDAKKIPLDDVLNILVKNYFRVISQNGDLYSGINIIVSGVVPPSNSAFNPSFPYYGSLEDRVGITLKLNDMLQIGCKSAGVHYIDTHTFFAGKDGCLIKELSDGNVHINPALNGSILEQLVNIIER